VSAPWREEVAPRVVYEERLERCYQRVSVGFVVPSMASARLENASSTRYARP
jgi:hypothetical protein